MLHRLPFYWDQAHHAVIGYSPTNYFSYNMWRIRSKLAGGQLCRVFDNQERTGQLLKSLLDLFSMKSVGRSGIFFPLVSWHDCFFWTAAVNYENYMKIIRHLYVCTAYTCTLIAGMASKRLKIRFNELCLWLTSIPAEKLILTIRSH